MLSDFYSKLFISNGTYECLLKQNFILLVVMQYKLNLPNILTLESNFTRSAIWFHHTTCVYMMEQIDWATRLKLIQHWLAHGRVWIDGNLPNTARFFAETVRSPVAIRTRLPLLYPLSALAILTSVSLTAGSLKKKNDFFSWK